MNEKLKFAIIFAIVLVICVTGGISIYANFTDEVIATGDRFEEKSDVEQNKTLQLNDSQNESKDDTSYIAKSGSKLTYKRTETISDKQVYDVYVDSKGNEYSYDRDGNLAFFTLNGETTDIVTSEGKAGNRISADEAIKSAINHGALMYGDDFDKYEFESCDYGESAGYYGVTFLAKIKFAVASYCFIDVLPNGEIRNAMIVREDYYENFNRKLLDGIEEQDVVDFVENEVAKNHPLAKSFEIQKISIEKKNNKYTLVALTEIYPMDTLAAPIVEQYVYKLK